MPEDPVIANYQCSECGSGEMIHDCPKRRQPQRRDLVPGVIPPGATLPLPPAVATDAAEKKKKVKRERYRPYTWRSYSWNDINNLPPLEIDEDGYAIRPHPVSKNRRYAFNEAERKVRFLMMYNFSGGSVTRACDEAGVVRNVYKYWLDHDPLFKAKLQDVREEIGDRLIERLSMSSGLIRQPSKVRIHNASLHVMLRNMRPDLFHGDADESGRAPERPDVQDDIPRPTG